MPAPTPLSPNRPYRWLLFDADGTLFDYDRAEMAALEAAFGRIGLRFQPNFLPLYRQINQDCWQALEQGRLKPEVLKVVRFEQFFAALGLNASAERFSAAYLECLAERSDLVEDALEVLDALRGQYEMAILTNGLRAVQRPRLARSAIRDHVREMIISEEIGAAKPAREFFDAAFARIGHPQPEQVLMIGDNWVSDIQGAAQYGVHTCWYNPGRFPRPSGMEITLEIASLRQLVPWLASRAQLQPPQ